MMENWTFAASRGITEHSGDLALGRHRMGPAVRGGGRNGVNRYSFSRQVTKVQLAILICYRFPESIC